MQNSKARSGSSEAPQRVPPRGVHQLKPTSLEFNSASSSAHANRTPKDRSPKVVERRSPRSPVSELQKKRTNRVSSLECQLSQLQDDLKKVKDQLISAESWKRRAQQEAEESKKELLAMSLKLEESQQQLMELSASEETHVIVLQKISKERDRAWQSELEAVQKQHAVDSEALALAMNEIQQLKVELDSVSESEVAQTKLAESVHAELQSVKGNLAETLSLLGSMKTQLRDCKESEAQAQALVHDTLLQLETAKGTVEALRLDGIKTMEAYDSIVLELDQSRARINLLEEHVSKLKVDAVNSRSNSSENPAGVFELIEQFGENQKTGDSNQLKSELNSVKEEMEQLRSALETVEKRYQEEQIQSTVQVRSAYELVEQVKSKSSLREAQLEAELKETKYTIEDLKANLMDKETELQGIVEENEGLNLKLKQNFSFQRESELETKLKKSMEYITDLKANLMDKETELQYILEENEMLKSEIDKRAMRGGGADDDATAQVAAARAAEREALMKLSFVTEEADKSNKSAVRVAEQLEAAQITNSEMEAELRRIKVQSDQWRKAAEAAAAMLSAGNNGNFMDRTRSSDGNYNYITSGISSPCSEDIDDDSLKKKNGNMLKKIGVLWKKPHK